MGRPVRLLRAAGSVVVTLLIGLGAACSGSDPGGGTESGTIRLWTLQSDLDNPVMRTAVDTFNGSSKIKIEMTTYPNDAYQQKLQAVLGTPDAPDIFLNWGGEALARYADAGQVADLAGAMDRNPEAAGRFLPAVLSVGKVKGRQYGLPATGVQPVLLFYNKHVFTEAGVQPPRSYDDLLGLVDTFKSRGIVPISLAGSQGWAELMYPMSLLDRIGGPQKFADIAAGRPGAWRDPAVLETLRRCQDLAAHGAFGSDFASADDDTAGASRLLATGRAAMQLTGAWEYADQRGISPDFATRDLGWTTFPVVSGGTGDPRNVVGPPGNLLSVSATSAHRDAAADFLATALTSDAYVGGLVDAGEVPAVEGADSAMGGTGNSAFATFVFKTVAAAPTFTPAWDQVLRPEVSTAVDTGLRKLFLSQMTPDEFATAVEAVK